MTHAGTARFQTPQKAWTKAQAEFERTYGVKRAKELRALMHDVTSRELG